MLQIQTFTLPDEQDSANAFLRAHRPVGEIIFSNNVMKAFYQDGVFGPAEALGELYDLLMSCHRTVTQHQVAVSVLTDEMAAFAPGAREYSGKKDELTALDAEISPLANAINHLTKKGDKAEREEKLEAMRELTAKKSVVIDELKGLEADRNQMNEKERHLAATNEQIHNLGVKIAHLGARIEELKAQLPTYDNDEETVD